VVIVAALTAVLLALLVRLLMPRFAHAMFTSGRYLEARRYYVLLAFTTIRPRRRAAARVSWAGTYLAAGRYADGARLLDAIDPARLDGATRAGWLNNRAYAALRSGARGAAAEAALHDVRAALALHPDVPGLLHTEALALLATGELDGAIRGLEALWERGDVPAQLEAERCDDLATAWAARGEHAYADDYRRRAARAVAEAPWRTATTAASEPVEPAPLTVD
jgi:predicted Zn-dependent protease